MTARIKFEKRDIVLPCDFKLGKHIASGKFGAVYSVGAGKVAKFMLLERDAEVEDVQTTSYDDFWRETRCLRLLGQKSLAPRLRAIKYIKDARVGALRRRWTVGCIIMDHCGRTLLTCGLRFPEKLECYMRQAAQLLVQFAELTGFLYVDAHLENFLVDDAHVVRLIDFGCLVSMCAVGLTLVDVRREVQLQVRAMHKDLKIRLQI